MKSDNNNIEIVNCNSVRNFMSLEPSEANTESFDLIIRNHTEGVPAWKIKDWYGSKTIEEVKRICREGWTEGLTIYEEVKRALPEIEIVGGFHKKYKRKRKNSDSGDEIDLDKYIHGEFDSMFIDYDKHIQDKEGKIITIYTSVAFHSGKLSSEAIWNGITSVILTDIFESVGYRVNLIGFISLLGLPMDSSFYKTQININIKLPNQALDLINILMATSYPGFFRYYGFKMLSSFPYKVKIGLGKPVQVPYIYEKNSFVIGNIWNNKNAYLKVVEILNIVKQRV